MIDCIGLTLILLRPILNSFLLVERTCHGTSPSVVNQWMGNVQIKIWRFKISNLKKIYNTKALKTKQIFVLGIKEKL